MDNNTQERLGPPGSLKRMVNGFLVCVTDTLLHVTGDTPFLIVINGLCMQLVNEVNARIVKLIQLWQKELPLYDQRPVDTDWEDLSARVLQVRDELMRHPAYFQTDGSQSRLDHFTPGDMAEQLQVLASQLLTMDDVLHPNDHPELFIGYSQNYLEKYELNHWAKKQRQWRNELSEYVTTHKKEFYVKQLNHHLDALSVHKPYIVSQDRKSIYKEALGVVLWRDTDPEQTRALEILEQVRSAKFFAQLLNKPLIFLDREITEEELEQHPELRKQYKANNVTQSLLPYIKVQCGWMKDYLQKGYSTRWVERFWDDAMKGEQKEAFGKKLATLKTRNKLVCQVLGELQSAKVYGGDSSQIASVIKEGVDGPKETRSLNYQEQLPTRATLKDYARKGVDDVPPIHEWIQQYVATHPKE